MHLIIIYSTFKEELLFLCVLFTKSILYGRQQNPNTHTQYLSRTLSRCVSSEQKPQILFRRAEHLKHLKSKSHTTIKKTVTVTPFVLLIFFPFS